MIAVRRLLAVGAILSLAALLASSHVWGEPDRNEQEKRRSGGVGGNRASDRLDQNLADELARSRFADSPLLVFQQEKGDQYFALQVKPKLDDAPARPRDYVVVVDTSASKARGPLLIAQEVAGELRKKLGPDDRLALRTANIEPRDLSRGLKPAAGLDDAFRELLKETPLGAVDLKSSLTRALGAFDDKEGRQRVLVYLGDGRSLPPLGADERADLAAEMVQRQVAYFAVPVGARLEPLNLHGLVNGTGGKVVRLTPGENVDKLVTRLQEAVAEPILYPGAFQLPPEVTEAFPTRLPPLRRDAATLVVGRLQPGARLDYSITGTVAGKEVRIQVSEKVPRPEVDNFFLVDIVNQWRQRKDLPASLPADRALAFAFDQHEMARADILAKAEWALEENKIDAALRLYEQALQLDPHSAEAKGGLALARKLRSGELKRQEMFDPDTGKRVALLDKEGRLLAQDDARPQPKPGEPPAPPAPDAARALGEARARQAIADQQATQMVNDAIRQANRQVLTDPDGAQDLLKRSRGDIADAQGLTPSVQATLNNRLSAALQEVYNRGVIVKRDVEEGLRLRAAAEARRDRMAVESVVQDQIRERMRVFHNLMDQGREQEAYHQAQAIRVSQLDKGLPVPPAVTAAYHVGLAGFNLREIQELRRIREERFLAVLMQVEKSHVPFPDEPPVEYPTPAAWKALSDFRKSKNYESSTFGPDAPPRTLELQKALSTPVKYGGVDDPKATLVEALDFLTKRYDVAFDVNERAFKYEQVNDVLKTEVAQPNPIPEMTATLGTILKKILARVQVPSGATYLIRRDVIEITTGQFATAEKTVRVYPAADLVTPIPNSFNTQMILQQATIFGALGALGVGGLGALGVGGLGALGVGGLGALGALGGGLGLGGLGALGALGGGLGLGGLGALGALGGGLGLGGLGALGALGGGLGLGGLGVGGLGALGALGGAGLGGMAAGGFNQIGMAGGGMGGFQGGFQGRNNLGVGGGVVGFGGGQLGQFGNLGGQFGLQGGNQSMILLTLVRQVVGRPKDWLPQFDPITGQPLDPLGDQAGEGLQGENNQLGYYPPSLALVVKASSTIHTRASSLIISPAGGAGMGAAGGPDNGARLARDDRKPGTRVAADGGERGDRGPKKKGPPAKPVDPKKDWQDRLARGVDNPGLIIATADYLALNNKFDHAAEFLKANLRQGIVVQPWVFQALAVALRQSGGSPEEIARAEMSVPDIQPLDSRGYLEAARGLARDKNYGRALALCRQAATLAPNVPHPYADALDYAELAQDARAMEWAAGHLLRQDWPVNNKELQGKAQDKLKSLVKALSTGDRRDEADRLREAVGSQRRRDLVIKLVWQGKADIDLRVKDPSGSVCSVLTPQSIGGGALLGDALAENPSRPGQHEETYTASQAFPGDHEIRLDRVWGRPLGDKVQLQIIRHQGTRDETLELLTVRLDSNRSQVITVHLDGGRRTETAYVPPPAALQPLEKPAPALEDQNKVLAKLRALADPEVTDYDRRGLRGDVEAPGRAVAWRPATRAPDRDPSDRTFYQTKVAQFVANSVDVTAQATISADRRFVRLSLNPVFNTVTGMRTIPVAVSTPVIPGGVVPRP